MNKPRIISLSKKLDPNTFTLRNRQMIITGQLKNILGQRMVFYNRSKEITIKNGNRMIKGPPRIRKPILRRGIQKPIKAVNIVRKCLLIGINYIGTINAVNGCINDSANLKQFLIDYRYFNANEITSMNDYQLGATYPTKINIMKQLDSLIRFAKNNSSKQVQLFVAYSGHGYFLPDENGDEQDGQDEVLCPIDFSTAGYISGDDIKKLFIDKLPANVKLTFIIDSCHTRSMCDLRFSYEVDARNTYRVIGKLAETKCNAIMISGCGDNQNSNNKNYKYQGAMTAAFLAVYDRDTNLENFIMNMRSWLADNSYEQMPQLSSGKYLNINKTFLLY